MLPPLPGLALAAAGLLAAIGAVRLVLRTRFAGAGLASWTMLPGLARGIRAWVRPRRPSLPVSFLAPPSDDEGDDATLGTPTVPLSARVGLRH